MADNFVRSIANALTRDQCNLDINSHIFFDRILISRQKFEGVISLYLVGASKENEKKKEKNYSKR